jgi:hypothetical protein
MAKYTINGPYRIIPKAQKYNRITNTAPPGRWGKLGKGAYAIAAGAASVAAPYAYDYARKYFPKVSNYTVPSLPPGLVGDTRVRKTLRKRKTRMAGFVRKGKTFRKKRFTKKFQSGVSNTNEVGGSVADPQLVGVGHITHPRQQVFVAMWKIVIKQLLARGGILLESETESISTTAETFDIVLKYRDSQNLIPVNINSSFNGGATIGSITTFFASQTRVWNTEANSISNQREFYYIEIVPTTPSPSYLAGQTRYVRSGMIRLEEYMVTVFGKSSLKIQNRTVLAAGDIESTDVDNQPLNGKTYEGTGSGMAWKRQIVASTMYADAVNGQILVTQANNGVFEPPPAWEYAKCKMTGKIRLNPGNLKTSVLTDTMKSNFSRLHNKLNPAANGATSNLIYPFGKYRVMLMEKMLQAQAAELNIVISYEVNTDIYCNGKEKRKNITIRSYAQTRGVNL